MRTQPRDSTRSARRWTPAIGLTLALLAGCSTDQALQRPPTALAQTSNSAPSKPLACTEFEAIPFNPGKPDVVWADVLAEVGAHPDNPLPWARGTLGDTQSTRRRLEAYQAARHALGCE